MENSVTPWDVIIISAFGRGAGLAGELARLNKKTAFIDITQAFPASSEEDLEGPYGFFLSPKITHQDWLFKPWVLCPQGFSVVTQKMPFHFKEFFFSSVYDRHPEYRALKTYLKNQKYEDRGDFKKSWLIHLCRSWASAVDFDFLKDEAGKAPPVFEEFGLLPYQKEFQTFLPPDVLFQSQTDHNLLIPAHNENFVISNQKGKSFKSRVVIFMLNPLEAYILHAPLFRLLFSKKKIIPKWSWFRFSFEFDGKGCDWPSYLVLADPKILPWTHERFMCIKKSMAHKNRVNVWVKLSYMDKGQTLNVDSLIQKILQKLQDFFPVFRWKHIPQAMTHHFLFPIYSFQDFQKIEFISHPRFFYSFNPFDLSPTGQALSEIQILNHLQN